MVNLPKFRESSTHISLFGALLQARKRYGPSREIIVDADDRVFTYNDLVRGSLALGSALKSRTEKKENIGILLPTGAGTLLSFFALHTIGRVPAMLNFSAGMHNIGAALKAAAITKIVTAHQFIKLADLGALEEQLKERVDLIYLEDVRERISTKNKIIAALGPIFPALLTVRTSYKDPGAILFTSGTEGNPKGVALNHKNLVANCEQVRSHVELLENDVLFNSLPTFHCFGLTGGALLPLFLGIKVALYPSPLHVKLIPERVKKTGATIMFGTDTFMSRYARAGKVGDFSKIRFAVCGAEQVRDETRAYVKEKYDLMILEGYGVTEAAPVVAVNQPEANRHGTVGHFLPGMEYRIDPLPGIAKGGRLFVRGPNVMMGYLTTDQPGVIQKLDDGWHDTGDVVEIDEDGYVAIRGRVKRFANISGEMISLAVVENCTKAVWPAHEHIALIKPDPKKGEQIVVLSDCPEANRTDILNWAQLHGVPELAVPRKVVISGEIPLLGSGKVDYQAAQELMERLI